jgi:putative spermidine/putrescine transport system ATP-binding protein
VGSSRRARGPELSARLEARGLAKSFGASTAVRAFDAELAPGEITVIIGPSGSGKSTVLRMFAGLTTPDRGRILLDGEDVTAWPAERRRFGMVFQSYALFPHLTVRENVEFGLKVRGMARAERRTEATSTLERLHVGHLADRSVEHLSGGEQQRVALARAIAHRPKVLLLDEPLSALDAKLRETLREELRAVLGELSITTVYVTHDATEAMSLGRSVAVMRAGELVQTGTPAEIYTRPRDPFVASLLGSVNVLHAECVVEAGVRLLRVARARWPAPAELPEGPVTVVLRPEALVVTAPAEDRLVGRVAQSTFLGARTRLTVELEGARILVDVEPSTPVTLGEHVGLVPVLTHLQAHSL